MNLGERYEIPHKLRNTYDPLNAKTHTHLLLRASNEEPRAETKSAVGRDVSVSHNVTGGSVLESLN